MKQYLTIEGKKFPMEDVAKALGVTMKQGTPVSLQVEVTGGSLEAIIPAAPTGIPQIGVWFNHDDPATVPFILSHTEQASDIDGNGNCPVITYLYDRADAYVGYLSHDTRSDDEVGDGHLTTMLTASGDADIDVEVYLENQYARLA